MDRCFGALLVIGSSAMWIGKPGNPDIIPALLLAYAIASVGVEFATVFNIGAITAATASQKYGMAVLVGFFVVGLMLLAKVRE